MTQPSNSPQRGGGDQKDGPNGKKFKSPWSFLLLGLGALVFFNLFFTPPRPDQTAYSEVKSKIKSQSFSKVILTDQYIIGELPSAGGEAATGMLSKKKRTLSALRPDADSELIKMLDESGIPYEMKYENTALRDFLLAWIIPLGLFFLLWTFFFKKMGAGPEVMRFGKSKSRLTAESDLKTTFDDVAGQDESKAELEEIVSFLKEPQKFTRLGGKLPKGILLVGPPGTGKTLLARAVAGEAKVPFFNISGSDFVEMFVGVGAARVRDLFNQAKGKAPCIIFIDELDAIGKARGVGNMGGHDEREQTLNQILVEMDGFESQAGVIIMAATNRPEILDPALLRAGRFDRQVMVGRPDVKEREAILKLHAENIQTGVDVDLETLAKQTPGMVGADLANVINEAALLAARHDKNSVEMQDLESAVERIITGLEKKNRVINKHEKEIIAHHEAGHAIVAAYRNPSNKVHKISIVPRGIGALGFTLQLPTEDRFLMTRDELIEKIDVLLGGQAAEKIIFEDISTGASDDLQRATDIARSMITQYGMGDTLGPSTVDRDRTPSYVDQGGIAMGKNFSEETARRIDEEVQSVMKKRMKEVQGLLGSKLDLLKKVATELLDREVLNDEDFQKIVDAYRKTAENAATA